MQEINLPSKLIMLPLNPNIQHLLMKIPLPSRPPQSFNLMILQPPPNRLLELLPTNLLLRLDLLGYLNARLEASLHPDPDAGLEGRGCSIAPDLDRVACFGFFCAEVVFSLPAAGLEGEGLWYIRGWDDEEGFEV